MSGMNMQKKGMVRLRQMQKNEKDRPVRVLYSFPHRLGADRICYTAWQQVNGLAYAGADLLVMPVDLVRPVPSNVNVDMTLTRGKLTVPYRVFGRMRVCSWHDRIVARKLEPGMIVLEGSKGFAFPPIEDPTTGMAFVPFKPFQ